MSRRLTIEIIVALYVLLFFYTAIHKIVDINSYNLILRSYPIVGQVSYMTAWILPIIEFSVVLLLFIPKTRFLGLYASLTLMSVFTIYLLYMLVFATKLPCTCGGILQKLSWPQHLALNIFFILMAVVAIYFQRKERKPNQTSMFQRISI